LFTPVGSLASAGHKGVRQDACSVPRIKLLVYETQARQHSSIAQRELPVLRVLLNNLNSHPGPRQRADNLLYYIAELRE